MPDTILVTGATGNVGSEVINQLQNTGHKIKAGVRDLQKAKNFGWQDVELVQFDYTNPESIEKAMSGVTKMFLVSPPVHAGNDELLFRAIDTAKNNGVKHIVDLSAMNAEKSENTLRNIELRLINSGVTYTILRPNWFMQNFATMLHESIMQQNGVYLPAGEAKTSFIDIRDIAAIAGKALTEPGHENKEYTLTGADSLTHHEVVDIIGKVSGKSLSYTALEENTAREMMLGAGWPESSVEGMLALYSDVRDGKTEQVSSEIESILGRKPITFKRFAEDYSDKWK